MPTATMTSKGQFTLPKKIREHFKLNPGDKLNFQILANSKVTVEPQTVEPSEVFGILKASRHVSLEEMEKTIRNRGSKK